CFLFFIFFFFFSSRRRHTRWPRDWSSDVCSSDLKCIPGVVSESSVTRPACHRKSGLLCKRCWWWRLRIDRVDPIGGNRILAKSKIGRASCRERVKISVVEGVVEGKESNR